MKHLLILLAIGLCIVPASAQFGKLLKDVKKEAEKITGSSLSQEQAGEGIKEALNQGVSTAVKQLSAENGYLESPYKILIPEDAQQVINKVKMVPGFENVETTLIAKMNEAAELAAVKAGPIFVDAITELTFKDALDLLMGKDDAATRYLENKTSNPLTLAFLPIIQETLDQVNAREYWRTVTSAYNKIPFVKKTNPELDQHVTESALSGMYGLIERKEEDIRNKPALRNTQVLRDVFSAQD